MRGFEFCQDAWFWQGKQGHVAGVNRVLNSPLTTWRVRLSRATPAMSVHSKTFKNCFALSRSVSYVSANGGDPYHHSVDTIERQFLQGNDALQGIVEKSVGGEPRTGCVQELTGGLKPRISYHLDEILTRTAPQTLQPKVKNQTPQNAS